MPKLCFFVEFARTEQHINLADEKYKPMPFLLHSAGRRPPPAVSFLSANRGRGPLSGDLQSYIFLLTYRTQQPLGADDVVM